MNLKYFIMLSILFTALHACKRAPDFFVGKWQILTVVDDNKSIGLIDNWMHLKSDGSFDSYDGDLKKNESGKWTYQLDERRLFIDGEGEEGDSHWNLSLRNDTLIFQSISDNVYLVAKKIE